jgi:hypothetical protein
VKTILVAVLWAGAAVAALCILVWPSRAYAWGPLAHIEFARAALDDLTLVPQALRLLLGKCMDEYLYGALAADIIVGKNLAPYGVHAHNWKVGFRVLELSRGEPERAFAYGYLAHLAVDTVAHNYFVPFKTVESYRLRRAGHAYWELRFDQTLDADLWKTARQVTRRALRRHDAFLKNALAGSYVLPFGLSRRFFEGMLVSARFKKWQRLSRLVAADRDLPLTVEEARELSDLAIKQVRDLLVMGEEAECTRADPTGLRNLRLAVELRKRLRIAHRGGREVTDRLMAEARIAFRDAIHGPIFLPALDSLYD